MTKSACYLLGDGQGRFAGPASFAAGTSPFWATVGDVNGDQKLDLAVTNGSAMGVLLGDDLGGFSPYSVLASGSNPSEVVTDFNRDQLPDLAFGNYGSNTFSVVLQRCQ